MLGLKIFLFPNPALSKRSDRGKTAWVCFVSGNVCVCICIWKCDTFVHCICIWDGDMFVYCICIWKCDTYVLAFAFGIVTCHIPPPLLHSSACILTRLRPRPLFLQLLLDPRYPRYPTCPRYPRYPTCPRYCSHFLVLNFAVHSTVELLQMHI